MTDAGMPHCQSCRAKGGLEAERAERATIKQEEEERDRKNFEFMQQIRREGWRKVRTNSIYDSCLMACKIR